MFIKFGKFKGFDVHDLPTDYLLWLHDQTWIGPRWGEDFARAVVDELHERTARAHGPTPPSNRLDKSVAREVIEAGFRVLAKQYHPDHGGAHDKMVMLNRVVDELRRMFE